MQYDLERILPAIISEPEIETRLSATVALEHYLRQEAAAGRRDWDEVVRQVLPSLLHAIGDSFKGVQVHAAKGLQILGEHAPQVMETLRGTMRGDDEWRAWGAAIVAGRMGFWCPEVGPALSAAMGGKDRDVRWAAANYLLQFARSQSGAVAETIGTLSAGNAQARKMSAYILGAMGGFAVVEPELVKALDDTELDVRRAAVLALDKLPAVSGETKAKVATMRRQDPNEYVRRTAAAVAGKWGMA